MEYKCSICLDSLFSVNTDVSVTQCGHLFHRTCIENSMQNKLECPKCKTSIETGIVQKIHPDVFDELVYYDCSKETETFLEEIYDYEKDRRIAMLDIIKKLDKQNTSLKNKNKRNEQNLKISEDFLRGFQTDSKKWQEKIQKLKLENSNFLAKIRELNNDAQIINNLSEDSKMESENKVNKIYCNDSCSITTNLVDKWLQRISFPNKNTFHLELNIANRNKRDYKGNILQTLGDNQVSFSNYKLVDKCISNVNVDVKKQLETFDEYNNKINKLLLNKIVEFENENKVLKEKIKSSHTILNGLETRLKNAQINEKQLKEKYKNIRKENKELLAKLQNSKEELENIDADLSNDQQNIIKTVRGNYNKNKNHYSNKAISNQGLLIICLLEYIKTF